MELKAVIITLFTISITLIECYQVDGPQPQFDDIIDWPRKSEIMKNKPTARPPIPRRRLVCPGHTITTDFAWRVRGGEIPKDYTPKACCGSNYVDMSTCFDGCKSVSSKGVVDMWGFWWPNINYTQCPCESKGSMKPFCPAGMVLRRTSEEVVYCCPSWSEGTDLCTRLCEPNSEKAVEQYYKDGGTLAWEETCVCQREPRTSHKFEPSYRSLPIEEPEPVSSSLTISSSIAQVLTLLIVIIIQQH